MLFTLCSICLIGLHNTQSIINLGAKIQIYFALCKCFLLFVCKWGKNYAK